MITSELSLLSLVEKLTLKIYQLPRKHSVIVSEVLSRLAASILLSTAAAIDFVFHSLMALPTFLYAIGKSIYLKKADFKLPWQHLQRIFNVIAPIILSSAIGLIHPFAGLAMCEPTDKHAVLGMLSSNTKQQFETPCSPIHSLSIAEAIATSHRSSTLNGTKTEIFTNEHIECIRSAKQFEKRLQSLQAQEFIHKITNISLFVMAKIKFSIENSSLSKLAKEIFVRVSGLLTPLLTAVDITINLLAQAFFLITGLVRLISGRGPIYTEVTTNPLMHVSFLIQNILKSLGSLAGMFAWFVRPMTGFQVSLAPSHSFFKWQMDILMSQIKQKMSRLKDNSRFVVPIAFGEGNCAPLSIPTHSMHKTYLIVEKEKNSFNLYWVNRPEISAMKDLNSEKTLFQIRSMLEARFPFMDKKKLLHFPVMAEKPSFNVTHTKYFAPIESQGNITNCVVSNLFGTLEALDIINGVDKSTTKLRYTATRKALTEKYDFYKNDFNPFMKDSRGFSLKTTWKQMGIYPQAAI